MAAIRLRSSARQKILMIAACAAVLFDWTGVAAAQAIPSPARQTPAAHRSPPRTVHASPSRSICADGEPVVPAVVDALAGGEAGFALLARTKPDEAFRCSGLFPGAPATAALHEAALVAPFDAIGAADQLSGRPGGVAIIERALNVERLTRALDTGLPFFETRHELRKRLPAAAVAALEERASKALAAAFAKDSAGLSMRIGALIDGMVDDPSKDRFRVAAALSVDGLFELIARIGPQLYTSSFDGILYIVESKLKAERRSFLELAAGPGTAPLWADFFVAVVSGGRADTLFGPAAGDARKLAKDSVRSLLSLERALDPPMVAGALADAMDVKSDDVRAALEDELAEHHRSATLPSIKAAAGLAGGLHVFRLAGKPATAAFTAERFGDLYPLPAAPALSENRLFQGGVNVQRVTFYNDLDGRESFGEFLLQYRTRHWTVHLRPEFVVVTSPVQRGRRIVIVADVPWAGEKSRPAVKEWLAREKLSPTIVVHRGHSYHEDETMSEIGADAALVFWGSCGGQLRLRATLDRAPDALVLATQNIGVGRVNQALLRTIEERLLADGAIDWTAVWADARTRIRDRRFSAYQRPDQNSTLLALRAWRTQTGLPHRGGPMTLAQQSNGD
ncbi:MAG: hypothetical protein K2X91_10695 [Thermoleophilia bacterium]|nr:hypothetical protein [Thermoleophilia bacterium]